MLKDKVLKEIELCEREIDGLLKKVETEADIEVKLTRFKTIINLYNRIIELDKIHNNMISNERKELCNRIVDATLK